MADSKRTGRVVTTRKGLYQAIIELADGSLKRLKPPFPPGTSLAYAKERALYWQGQADAKGLRRPEKPAREATTEPAAETVSQWFERWTLQREAEGVACVTDDRGRFRTHVAPVIGGRVMDRITHTDIDDVVDALNDKVTRKELSWRTAANVWGVVSKVFTDAVRKKGFRALTENPCERVEPPKRGEEKAFTYLYPAEFMQLISEATVPILWRRMIAVSVFLGLRSSELTALRCGDIDMDHGIVNVRRSLKRDRTHQGETKAPKAGRAKKIPIPENLRPLLEVLTEGRDAAETVFPYRKITGRADKLRDFMRRAGLERVELLESSDLETALRWHDLRATTATWLAIDGADTKAIKARLRHATEKMSEKYIHEAELFGTTRGERIARFGLPFPELPETLLADHFGDHAVTFLNDSGAGHEIRIPNLAEEHGENSQNEQPTTNGVPSPALLNLADLGDVIRLSDHANGPAARAFRGQAWRWLTARA